MFTKLKNFVWTSKEKAIVGAVVAAVTAYLSESGLTFHDILTKKGLWAFLVGVAVHLSVYLKSNTPAGA